LVGQADSGGHGGDKFIKDYGPSNHYDNNFNYNGAGNYIEEIHTPNNYNNYNPGV